MWEKEKQVRLLLSLLLLFFLEGCALNRLFLLDEINTVNVVKYNTHLKHYRAYFARSDLRPVAHKRKYIFFYNPKKSDLSLLLNHQGRYVLYSFTNPHQEVRLFKQRVRVSSRTLFRILAKRGYRIANLTQLGFDVKVGRRLYKGVKTLMFEVKDYRNLKKQYRLAIKTHQPSKVAHLHTPLPQKFIRPYFEYYRKRAKTPKAREALYRIGKQLHLAVPGGSTQKHPTSTESQTTEGTPTPSVDRYSYYLQEASLYELSNYLDTPKSRQEMGATRYRALQQRLARLKEEKLLKESSLESLIEAYKQNHNPRFKARILELMKEKQSGT